MTITDPKLYVNTVHNSARQAIDKLARSGDSRASILSDIVRQPISFWVEDEQSINFLKDIVRDAASKQETPIVTLYLIPGRDNGGFSAGGAIDDEHYLACIERIAQVLAPLPSIIIVEPDAVAHAEQLGPFARRNRMALLASCVSLLKSVQPRHAVYIDAGHARWLAPRTAAHLLLQAGVSNADGFSLNVSNFVPTTETIAYGEAVSGLLGGAHFVIDTSRNGSLTSPDGTFNPAGRKLGHEPTTDTGHELVDAYLWIKVPGESDGGPGAPPAGVFWPDYAYGLATATSD